MGRHADAEIATKRRGGLDGDKEKKRKTMPLIRAKDLQKTQQRGKGRGGF